MPISIVVAVSTNNVIGKNGELPWRLPEDIRHFKKITMGKPVIMGRSTWESIGHPLPGRLNIVMSRRPGIDADNYELATSVDQALLIAGSAEETMIIGGSQVYRQFLPRTDRIYLTRIHAFLEGDTFFPELDEAAWQAADCEHHEAVAGGYAFDFVILNRIR